MIDALKFVRGSIGKSKNDFALHHFVIRDQRIRGFNGTFALSSPIPVDIEAQPRADQLIQAIGHCMSGVEMSMTPAKKLRLRSGNFRAFINCHDEPLPEVLPEGVKTPVDGAALLDAMKKLLPFVGESEHQQWTGGVLFKGKSAFATDNVVLAEVWIGSELRYPANIPAATVKELIRINQVPTHIAQSGNSMTFFYDGDRWLNTRVIVGNFPDLSSLIEHSKSTAMKPFPKGFWEAVESIESFQDAWGRLFFRDGFARTSMEQDVGALVKLEDFMPEGIFQFEKLKLLKNIATRVDFSKYPANVPWQGNKVRGLIVGMRSGM